MATYTSIPTFTSGQVLTSARMNDIKNNLDLVNAQSAYPYRNLLYNGAMQIHQRGTSVTGITTDAYRTADRWKFSAGTLGTWTNTIENDAPTGTGLRKSFKLLCTTANASPSAALYNFVEQNLEGYDLQRIQKGTASANAVTLSFWVKSNVTGTYVVGFQDFDNTRIASATYTISASATWEQKIITFPADTTGAFDNDENASARLTWWLAAGSNWTSGTLNTAWATTVNANRAVGQVNVAAATNNYWQITGVQLETGSVSTPFEFLPYGDELARCQRYYYLVVNGTGQAICTGSAYNGNTVSGIVAFPATMRATPVGDITNGTSYWAFLSSGSDAFDTVSVGGETTARAGFINGTGNVATTAGWGGSIVSNNASAKLAFSAEL